MLHDDERCAATHITPSPHQRKSKRVTACCHKSRPTPPTSPHVTSPHPARRYMVSELVRKGIPVITPAGGLGVHVDAMRFVDHIPQIEVGCRQLGQGQLFATTRQCSRH